MITKLILKLLKYIQKLLVFSFPRDIKSENNKSIRISIINYLNNSHKNLIKAIHSPLNFFYENQKNKIFVEVDGVFLSTANTYRYFKITDEFEHKNQGKGYEQFFKNTKKNVFVDLGSNIGEISIYIAKNYPNAKVISVEGSPNCTKIQDENIKINQVQNIILENKILSNENSFEYISNHWGTENVSSKSYFENSVKIESITILKLFQKHKVELIDFLKIDIEGAIPNLTEDLIYLWKNKKIKSCAMSFEKNSFESYKKIIDVFTDSSNIYEFKPNSTKKKIINKLELEQKIKDTLFEYKKNNLAYEVLFELKVKD